MVFNVSWNGEHNLSASMLNYRCHVFYLVVPSNCLYLVFNYFVSLFSKIFHG
jgi:hypothetical protein